MKYKYNGHVNIDGEKENLFKFIIEKVKKYVGVVL